MLAGLRGPHLLPAGNSTTWCR